MNATSISTAVRSVSKYQWIDVRSLGEYAAGHIPGAVNIPMDQIEARLDDLLPSTPILLVCQAGKRARMVAGLLEPCRSDVTVLEGGTAAWAAAGQPLVTNVKSRFSLERQVRLIAGSLVLVAILLSLTLNHHWIFLAAAVGAGLTFAGLTDICMMASLLTRMPWNQPRLTRPKDAAVNPQSCNL
ncbi:MAG: rhodanese-like domain-containing protein [Terriglobales bacterium]